MLRNKFFITSLRPLPDAGRHNPRKLVIPPRPPLEKGGWEDLKVIIKMCQNTPQLCWGDEWPTLSPGGEGSGEGEMIL